MYKALRFIVLVLVLSSCAVTHHGYWGPGNSVPHATLYPYIDPNNGRLMPFIDIDNNVLNLEFVSLNNWALSPDDPDEGFITAVPGQHKIITRLTMEKSGRGLQKELVEFNLNLEVGTSYYLKAEWIDENNVNVWVENGNRELLTYKISIRYL